MSKMALFLGAILILSGVFVPGQNETEIPKGIHASDMSVARDPDTGLPLVNPVKGPAPEHASPRGDRL
ncbi:MAG: hypothetical protein RLZZ342_348 [Candidatus Parcubacteria bacterium]|jgi:hypothetical protein